MVMIYGHRGLSSLAPENTIAAFELIRAHDVPGVELDVYQCATGEIVVAHDKNLKRTAGVELDIQSSQLAAIREHDIGSWFSPEFRGQRVPLLTEVFDLLGDSVRYDIEIKPHARSFRPGPGVEEETVRLIRERNLESHTIVSSFDPFVARKARLAGLRHGIAIPVAVIYTNHPDMPWFLRNGQGHLIAGASAMKPGFAEATAEHIAYHHKRGRSVMAWTIDTVDDARAVVTRGVDAIISNRPSEILAGLK